MYFSSTYTPICSLNLIDTLPLHDSKPYRNQFSLSARLLFSEECNTELANICLKVCCSKAALEVWVTTLVCLSVGINLKLGGFWSFVLVGVKQHWKYNWTHLSVRLCKHNTILYRMSEWLWDVPEHDCLSVHMNDLWFTISIISVARVYKYCITIACVCLSVHVMTYEMILWVNVNFTSRELQLV